MKITESAVARPIGTAIIWIGVLILGLVALDRLAVDLLPEVDFPRISIVTQYDGVGPEEMETLVTRPIEQQVSTLDGVDEIEAESAEGLSRIQLHFAWGTNLETAVNDVRAYLDRLGSRLPDDAERPVVYKFDLASTPIASIGVSGGGDPRRLRYLAEETLGRRLERVPGIASVQVRGGRVREIRVALDASKLVALGVSSQQVVEALRRDNRNVSAGDMRATGREVLVRSVAQWDSPDEISDAMVAMRGGRAIYVRDVAEVIDTFVEAKSEHWVDGSPGITLRITKQSGANTVAAVEALRDEIAAINRDYDGRLRLNMISNSGDYIESSITNVQTSALFGAVLAIVILMLFLRDPRATVLIAVAIPLSVVATFALMGAADFSLNVISFGGLALGIGMLVDNSIVILENIHRKREDGHTGTRAAIDGAREVAGAVVSGTVTTVAVFAPVIFIGGFAGLFFAEMAWVVTFALTCSLAVALTLVPTLAARVLGPRRVRAAAPSTGPFARLEGAYSRTLAAAMRAPLFVLGCALVVFLASMRLGSFVEFELMPETDEGRIDVDVDLPVGTPVEDTAVVIQDIERRVRSVVEPEEINSVVTSAGPENWWRPGGGHEGEVEVMLVPVGERERGIEEIIAGIRGAVSGIPDASIRITRRSSNMLMRIMRGGSGERLSVEIRGHDLDTSAALADRVREVMLEVEGIAEVRVDRAEGLEERTVDVDAARAADLGLTRAEVADTLETYVLGTIATRLRQHGDEFDVRVELRESDRREVDRLGSLPILTASGEAVPLSTVATIGGRLGPTSISREGQERVVRVNGDLEGRTLSAVVADLEEALSRMEKPEGFTVVVAGETEQQDETFGNLGFGILLALLLVYAVMAVQFESLRHPLIIMAAVPFGFTGVVIALVTTGTTFNMNSFLGSIVLVGIAVNNAIVLVDYTNLLRREEGLGLAEAVAEAGRRRLRPILMTTLTTVFAMVPLAFELGEGSEIQAPLARVVIGGLIVSSLVTLIIVPCLYYLVERRRAARDAGAAAG